MVVTQQGIGAVFTIDQMERKRGLFKNHTIRQQKVTGKLNNEFINITPSPLDVPDGRIFQGGGGEHLRVFSLVEQSSDRVFVIKTTGELCIHQKVEYVRKACCRS